MRPGTRWAGRPWVTARSPVPRTRSTITCTGSGARVGPAALGRRRPWKRREEPGLKAATRFCQLVYRNSIDGSVTANSVTLASGNDSLSGGTIDLGAAGGTIDVGGTPRLYSTITGGCLAKVGPGCSRFSAPTPSTRRRSARARSGGQYGGAGPGRGIYVYGGRSISTTGGATCFRLSVAAAARLPTTARARHDHLDCRPVLCDGIRRHLWRTVPRGNSP